MIDRLGLRLSLDVWYGGCEGCMRQEDLRVRVIWGGIKTKADLWFACWLVGSAGFVGSGEGLVGVCVEGFTVVLL